MDVVTTLRVQKKESKEVSIVGKRIVVTGAASGIGKAFAQLVSAEGAHTALLDVDAAGLRSVSDGLDGCRISRNVDLTRWDATETALLECHDALGGLDVVAHVAGWDAPGRFWEQDMDHWHRLIDVNLWGALHVVRAGIGPMMAAGRGSIVLVSSDAGRVGSKGETVYAAAKGGVIALTKSLARELAAFGITVNCVSPGPTMTPLLEQEMKDNPKLIDKMIRAVPLKRVATPEDQAAAIRFFSGPESSYITGQILSVSGGLVMAD